MHHPLGSSNTQGHIGQERIYIAQTVFVLSVFILKEKVGQMLQIGLLILLSVVSPCSAFTFSYI
jgi:hypothetical protein